MAKSRKWSAARRKAHARRIRAAHKAGRYKQQPERLSQWHAARRDSHDWPSVADARARLSLRDDCIAADAALRQAEAYFERYPGSAKGAADVQACRKRIDELQPMRLAEQQREAYREQIRADLAASDPLWIFWARPGSRSVPTVIDDDVNHAIRISNREALERRLAHVADGGTDTIGTWESVHPVRRTQSADMEEAHA